MANHPMSRGGSGMQELYKVLSLLAERSSRPVFAIANRRIFSQDDCEVWALSPFDKEFEAVLEGNRSSSATGIRNKKAHSCLDA